MPTNNTMTAAEIATALQPFQQFLESQRPTSPKHRARMEGYRQQAAARWLGWRVFAVDIVEAEDDLARLNVFADPATGQSASGMYTFSFLTDGCGRKSARLNSFLNACGMAGIVEDAREIEGRYFAARDIGRAAEDFGPLANALNA